MLVATATLTPPIVIIRRICLSFQRATSEFAVNHRQVRTQTIKLIKVTVDSSPLVGWQQLLLEPSPTSVREEFAGIGWNEVAVQNRVNLILQASQMPDELSALCDSPPKALGIFIRYPDLR
jgi:hypothetical protein